MFTEYYCSTNLDEFYYLYIKDVGGKYIISFYRNEELLETRQEELGKYTLGTEDVSLDITIGFASRKNKLWIKGEDYKLKKIKKSRLQDFLSKKGIHNEVNPTKKQLEELKFNPKVLLKPIGFSLVALILQFFMAGKEQSFQVIPAVFSGAAGWMIYGILSNRFEWLKGIRKAPIGFAILMIAVIGALGKTLIKYLM